MSRWTWIEVMQPWNLERTQEGMSLGMYRQYIHNDISAAHEFDTFDTASEAVAHMCSWMAWQTHPAFAKSIALLRAAAPAGEFLLWDREDWPRAWMVFKIPDGAHPAEAAEMTYRRYWRPSARESYFLTPVGQDRGLWSASSQGNEGRGQPSRQGTDAPRGNCLLMMMMMLCVVAALAS